MKKKIRKLKVKKLGVLSDVQMSILLGGGDPPNGDLTLPSKPSAPTNCLPPPAGATTRATTASGVPTCPPPTRNESVAGYCTVDCPPDEQP